MSDSRLEKFIYAICSMDVSDLPVPLSRIEKLWNCLITGETPDFEPLSRNEKYLMAMLDRYDISNLPAPMSRGEKLLYKIVVGETDLSDVPGYLSRYEELLKYLIENGGISGGDFEYVLYTLNQSLYTLYTTAEKPVKSAILKGNTEKVFSPLKNLFDGFLEIGSIDVNNGVLVSNTNYYRSVNFTVVEPSTIYVISTDGAVNGRLFYYDINFNFISASTSSDKALSPSNAKYMKFRVDADKKDNKIQVEKNNVVTDYEEPNYILQSVKMPVLTTTGKNLFDGTFSNHYWDAPFTNGQETIVKGGVGEKNYASTGRIKVEKGKTYTISGNNRNRNIVTCFYTTDANELPFNGKNDGNNTFEATYDGYIEWYLTNDNINNPLNNIQIEEGSTATPYEPYKSNILTVNEELSLKGVDDVKDELNCLTGEVTERIGEIVLDGSENWVKAETNENTIRYYVNNIINTKNVFNFYNDRLTQVNQNEQSSLDQENICIRYDYTGIGLRISKTKATNESELKSYLQSNPITLQYQLKTESIKTVDLTVVDQDGQPTELGTFENVTHVSLEAENLIPEVEMEVATNLLEDTVFNLTDAFNTLYPTAAKPVKSAILKGQTLVNNYNKNTIRVNNGGSVDGNVITLAYNNGKWVVANNANLVLKPLTKYLILINVLENTIQNNGDYSLMVEDVANNSAFSSGFTIGEGKVGIISKILTTKEEFTSQQYQSDLRISNAASGHIKFQYMIIEYQEGMENWDIPYFEGMQSVKMPVLSTTGKNLFGGELELGDIGFNDGIQTQGDFAISKNFNVINGGVNVICSIESSVQGRIYYYDGNKNYISTTLISNLEKTPQNAKYFKLRFNKEFLNSNIMMVYDTSITPYEPYKSNILTVNEEVELRGIGEVKDELDLQTGKLTQRIGELVLDDSRTMDKLSNYDLTNTHIFALNLPNKKPREGNGIVNIFKTMKGGDSLTTTDVEGAWFSSGGNQMFIRISKTKLDTPDIAGFKKYLSRNEVRVQYELETESVKTVDLTTVDQDGNETKLRTFDDTTHVLLESEGLIPTASLTVRTKIPSASSTSLLIDELSVEQQQLEATVDEQSENADATMIATTEIYEETL